MNNPSADHRSLGRIDLAHESNIAMGSVELQPALRNIVGDGWSETIEPRVMQVLVALLRARGEVVSRDDLIRSCWDGRAVGEDAIYRCVARLRQILETKHGVCNVETVPRVGYRLRLASQSPLRKPRDAPEREAFNELIAHIYDCAIDPTQWDDALAHVVNLFSPADWDVASLMWESVAPPCARFVGATGVSTVARDVYMDAFAGRSPWSKAIAMLPVGRVADTDEIMPREELTTSAFYTSFLSTWKIELAVAAVLDRDGPDVLALVMPGPVGRQLQGLKDGLRLLAPHLQRAVRISRSLGEANLRANAAEAALDRAPVAIATLAADLSIVNLNAKALALVDTGEIALRNGRFSFADANAQRRLEELTKAAPPTSATFRVHDSKGREIGVLAARLKTLIAPTLAGKLDGASIVVSIGIGERAPLLEIDRLSERFGLTATEARLVTALAGDDTLRAYAERRNLSMNAVKFLLQSVYRKTETTSLEQLLSRLRGVL